RNTPLHIACINGHEDVVEALLEPLTSWDLTEQSEALNINLTYNKLPVSGVSGFAYSASVLAIDRLRSAVTTVNSTGLTPLHLAAASMRGAACLARILFILSASAELVETDLEPGTIDSSSPCTQALAIRGGREGSTPLHMAAMYGRFDRVQNLLAHGADPLARDSRGNTPLHVAASCGHGLFVDSMLRAGVPWNCPGEMGSSALHLAAMAGYSCCLLRYPAPVTASAR
ncbi:unnamed protein product, partial [Protopolystoma xenopodis]